MSSMAAWWKEWRAFMFEKSVTINDKKEGKKTTTPAKMLPPIKRAKYPAVTEAEEAISVPLQALLRSTARAVALLRPTASPSAALPFGRRVRAPRQLRPTRMRPTRRCMAIFDAILMHIVSECSPDGTWLKLKLQMLEKLYAKKDQRIIELEAQLGDPLALWWQQTMGGKKKKNKSSASVSEIRTLKAGKAEDQ